MRRKSAFTLVELLVVIGIIALLISILLPALNAANEQAKRTRCLSNLRELGMACRLYATANRDQVPIGHLSQSQFSYVVNFNQATTGGSPTKPVMLGLLALSKLTPSPQVFYCPDTVEDTFRYNTPDNIWPPFEKYPNDPRFMSAGFGHTRVSYNMRPIADWPASGTNLLPTLVNLRGSTGLRGFAKFSRLKNLAIISDLIISPGMVKNMHKKGINVLFANGSGQWTRTDEICNANSDTITKGWLTIAYNDVQLSHNDKFLRTLANGTLAGVWANLDKASK